MRKIVVTEFITLDGVMEDPGGSEKTKNGGWAFLFDRGPEGDKFKTDELNASGAQLLGRVTYEEFAKAWPSRTGEFADKLNNSPKYVVSRSLKKADWKNTTIFNKNIFEEIENLKAMPGGDILVAGSRLLVNGLMEHGLVDEYRLMVFPIVLGKGKKLFEDQDQKQALKLVEVKPVGNAGVITMVYRPDNKD